MRRIPKSILTPSRIPFLQPNCSCKAISPFFRFGILHRNSQMAPQVSDHPHVVEVDTDRPIIQRAISGNKVCEGAPCGFSDAKSSNERSVSMKKLWIAIVMCVVFMTVEVIGGVKANSLAIMTDAAHLLSDVAAFAISLFSLWASGWEANPRQSYGFFRIEILGALVSIQMIWLLAGILVYEAIARLINGTGEVQGFLMFLVSAFGLVVNIIMALVLGHDHGHSHGHGHGHGHHGHDHHGHDHHGHGHSHESTGSHHHHGERDHGEEDDHMHTQEVSIMTHHHHHSEGSATHAEHHHESDLNKPLLVKSSSASDGAKFKKQGNINVQGAYLHVLGDSIQSVGVMIGGAVIWYNPEWKFVDLICTLVFSVIVLGTTIRMLRSILEVLMESTPREIDATRLENGLCEMDEVVAIHELHIWAITVGKVLLACHVKVTPEADPDLVLDKVIGYIKREYNISHVTVQIEREYV